MKDKIVDNAHNCDTYELLVSISDKHSIPF
jgi:hypothetical protein